MANKNYTVEIIEAKGACDTALFKKMASSGDITSSRINDMIDNIVPFNIIMSVIILFMLLIVYMIYSKMLYFCFVFILIYFLGNLVSNLNLNNIVTI